MTDTGFIYARDLEELYRVSALIPRDAVQCVKCDSNTELSCPNNCAENEVCVYKAPSDCSQCATSSCILAPGMPEKKGGSGPNIGGIVGGVIGGIVAITVLTYLIWRYCIKPKRSEMSPSIYEPDPENAQGSEKDTASRRTRPPSTHTVHSIASTVLTRASNIIQIAYIPGVTNRATPTSPAVLVPPVPPIPMHHAAGNRGSGYEEQHFFVPGDLRDSTYSGLSGYSDRTSYARTSYAPRSSIASTIYGKQAQVLAPAQTGMRAKPTVVSVKSVGNSSTDNSSTPPLPSINFEKYTTRPKSGASAFSVGSTFLNSANTATQARAQVVKVGTGLKKIEISSIKSETSSSAPSLAAVSPAPSMKNTARDSNAITIIEDSPSLDQGPFSDPPERSSPQKSINAPSLGAVVEEDGADDRGMIRVAPPPREKSPFGDQHATKEQP